MPSRRVERVNVLIRRELSDLISRTLRDPRIAEVVSITEVRTSPDLRHARVFVSVLGTPEEREATVTALQTAARFLRHELTSRLTMRNVPDLTFRADESIERGERIMDLLRQVGSPPAGDPTGGSGSPGE